MRAEALSAATLRAAAAVALLAPAAALSAAGAALVPAGPAAPAAREAPGGPITLTATMPRAFFLAHLEDARRASAPGSPVGAAGAPEPGSGRVWGVTVPHHLLAADMIAAALVSLAEPPPERVLLLSPDHFGRGRTRLTLVDRPISGPTGLTAPDAGLVRALAAVRGVSSADAGIVRAEHGVGGVLPFLRALWPKARIVALVVRYDATAADMAALQPALLDLVRAGDALIVHSGDFSHGLEPAGALRRDDETLAALAAPDAAGVWRLVPGEHCDSVNVLALMKALQLATGSRITVLGHRNAQAYTTEPLSNVTSYFTLAFAAREIAPGVR